MKKGKPKYKAVAKNRRPRYEQEKFGYKALSNMGYTRQQISMLHVKKSIRYYNDTGATSRAWSSSVTVGGIS